MRYMSKRGLVPAISVVTAIVTAVEAFNSAANNSLGDVVLACPVETRWSEAVVLITPNARDLLCVSMSPADIVHWWDVFRVCVAQALPV